MSQIIRHNGRGPVHLRTQHDPDSQDIYGVIWDQWRMSDETFTASSWIVDPLVTIVNEIFPSPMLINGVQYQHVSAIVIEIDAEADQSTLTFTNRIESDIRKPFDRSFTLYCGHQ